MAFDPSYPPARMPPRKRLRRTATAVMAGDFDPRPARDALTSVLNVVGPKPPKETDEEKKVRKAREKEEKKAAKAAARFGSRGHDDRQGSTSTGISARNRYSSFWGNPQLYVVTNERSVSLTPPPIFTDVLLTPSSTPGPSESCSTSRTSSKRPHTPTSDDDIKPFIPRVRKKKIPVKKGWKGWVEGSPPATDKLINLDAVPILHERRTRSGKNFDAIGP